MRNRPERTRYIREKKNLGLRFMTSKTRWVAIDIHHSTITGLPPLPHHLVYLSQRQHNTLYLWDALRFAVSRVLPPFLYTLWDMVFHAISAHLNHLISTHIGVISYLLHIVSILYLNHYISHIPISRTLLFFSIRDIVYLSPLHFPRPASRSISYIHTLHLV